MDAVMLLVAGLGRLATERNDIQAGILELSDPQALSYAKSWMNHLDVDQRMLRDAISKLVESAPSSGSNGFSKLHCPPQPVAPHHP